MKKHILDYLFKINKVWEWLKIYRHKISCMDVSTCINLYYYYLWYNIIRCLNISQSIFFQSYCLKTILSSYFSTIILVYYYHFIYVRSARHSFRSAALYYASIPDWSIPGNRFPNSILTLMFNFLAIIETTTNHGYWPPHQK